MLTLQKPFDTKTLWAFAHKAKPLTPRRKSIFENLLVGQILKKLPTISFYQKINHRDHNSQ
jgi:hypothetical protein